MNRHVDRVWRRLAGLGMLLGAALLPVPVLGAEYRVFWVDAWGDGFRNQSQVETLLGRVGDPNSRGRIRDANCNAVIVQVRRRADVCCPSGVGEPYFSGPSNFNALQAMINAAHDTTGGKQRVEVRLDRRLRHQLQQQCSAGKQHLLATQQPQRSRQLLGDAG